MKHSNVGFILFAILCLAAGAACADNVNQDCVAAKNPLKPAEKAFFAKFTVLRAAMPKPPAGWQYDDGSKEKLAPDYVYMPASECEISNYYIGLEVGYDRPMTQADADKEMAAMQAKPDPAKQKKLDALMAEQQAVVQKIADAAQKQQMKSMEALGKQNDALSKQIGDEQADINSGTRATMDAVQRDRKASVRIAVNDGAGDLTCYGDPKLLQVAGATAYTCGHPATYSSPSEQQDPASGHVVVVYGKATVESEDWEWKDAQGKSHPDHYVEIKMPLDDTVVMGVQFVTIDAQGDDLARAQSLYKQMNLKPLAALVKH